jgi:2-polyprenyl-6-methoxyphenol hydroxylase-like FAD-dependent oxidoreductase
VVEKAPALRPGGQAVDFKGRTHRTVLERMGVWEEIQQRRTGAFDTVYLDAKGRELAVMTGEFTGGDVEILRGISPRSCTGAPRPVASTASATPSPP